VTAPLSEKELAALAKLAAHWQVLLPLRADRWQWRERPSAVEALRRSFAELLPE